MSARERAELDNQRKERRPVDPMNNLIAELIRRGRYMIKRLVGDMPPVVPFRLCEIEHGPKPTILIAHYMSLIPPRMKPPPLPWRAARQFRSQHNQLG